MEKRILSSALLKDYRQHLVLEEKSHITIEKYMRDITAFQRYTGKSMISKELVIAYKEDLLKKGYAPVSINSMLAAVNGLLRYLGWSDCAVKNLRTQHRAYCPAEKELTKEEYLRLLDAAKGRPRLFMLLQTICSTGIRVSELSYFTVEAVKSGEVTVHCKTKLRKILLPKKLCKMLLQYAQKNGIRSGVLFCTRSGKPLHRGNIWHEMKNLCQKAKVDPQKVFPHNLRKLFARTFYNLKQDIAKLADVLGHSNINTTRIYIMSCGTEHRKQMDRMDLLFFSPKEKTT